MRFKSKLTLFAVLALFALVIASGGCGGSSSGKSDSAKLYKIGEINAATVAAMNKAKIEVVQFDPSMTASVPNGSSFVMQEQGMTVISGDAKSKDLQEMLTRCYATGGEIVLLSSDKAERDYLLGTVLADYELSDANEGVIKVFGVTRETSGNTRSINIDDPDDDVKSNDEVYHNAVLSGDKWYVDVSRDIVTISEDEEGNPIEPVSVDVPIFISDNFKIIISEDVTKRYYDTLSSDGTRLISADVTERSAYMIASGDTYKVSCDSVESGDITYELTEDTIISYDNTISEDEAPEVTPDLTDRTWDELYEWLMFEESEEKTAEAKASAMAAAASESASSTVNLADVATYDTQTYSGTLNGKGWTINLFVTPVHNFADATDWYIIRQECTINSGQAYESSRPYKWIDCRLVKRMIKNYIMTYTVANNLTGSLTNPMLSHAAPQSINKETKHSESHGFKIGAEVGVGVKDKKPDVSGKLSFGADWSSSKSWSVSDVVCAYRPKDLTKAPTWIYTFNTRPIQRKWPNAHKMIEPKDENLSRTALSFENFWVWRFNAGDRSKNPTLEITPSMESGEMYTYCVGFTHKTKKSSKSYTESKSKKYTFIAPPRIAVSDTEVIFKDKNENSRTLDIRSDNDWIVSVDGSPSWCKAKKGSDEGNPKKLLIEMAEENNTKSARTAKVVITSGTDKYVIYVTQSMTSKY